MSMRSFFQNRSAAAVGMCLVVLAALWWWQSEAPAVGEASPPPPAVPVAQVRVKTLAPYAQFTGYLEPVEAVDLMPRVSGQLIDVTVPGGDQVRAGAVLFRIDPAPFAARLAEAQAALQRAEAAAGDARRVADRAERLLPSRAISEREAEEARAALVTAQADVAASRAAVRQASLQLEYTNVRAPISGRVDRILLTRGNIVSSSESGTATRLTRIVRSDQLHLYFDVDEATYGQIVQAASGSSADITLAADPSVKVTGRVDFAAPEVDRDSGTVRLRAVLPASDPRLKPGAFARIAVPIGPARPTVLIPEVAVGTDQDRRFVLVVGRDNVTEYRPVVLGQAMDGWQVVTVGLQPGERVVVKGLVRPGMAVVPRQWTDTQDSGTR